MANVVYLLCHWSIFLTIHQLHNKYITLGVIVFIHTTKIYIYIDKKLNVSKIIINYMYQVTNLIILSLYIIFII